MRYRSGLQVKLYKPHQTQTVRKKIYDIIFFVICCTLSLSFSSRATPKVATTRQMIASDHLGISSSQLSFSNCPQFILVFILAPVILWHLCQFLFKSLGEKEYCHHGLHYCHKWKKKKNVIAYCDSGKPQDLFSYGK